MLLAADATSSLGASFYRAERKYQLSETVDGGTTLGDASVLSHGGAEWKRMGKSVNGEDDSRSAVNDFFVQRWRCRGWEVKLIFLRNNGGATTGRMNK